MTARYLKLTACIALLVVPPILASLITFQIVIGVGSVNSFKNALLFGLMLSIVINFVSAPLFAFRTMRRHAPVVCGWLAVFWSLVSLLFMLLFWIAMIGI